MVERAVLWVRAHPIRAAVSGISAFTAAFTAPSLIKNDFPFAVSFWRTWLGHVGGETLQTTVVLLAAAVFLISTVGPRAWTALTRQRQDSPTHTEVRVADKGRSRWSRPATHGVDRRSTTISPLPAAAIAHASSSEFGGSNSGSPKEPEPLAGRAVPDGASFSDEEAALAHEVLAFTRELRGWLKNREWPPPGVSPSADGVVKHRQYEALVKLNFRRDYLEKFQALYDLMVKAQHVDARLEDLYHGPEHSGDVKLLIESLTHFALPIVQARSVSPAAPLAAKAKFDISITRVPGGGRDPILVRVHNYGPTQDFQAVVEYVSGFERHPRTPFNVRWETTKDKRTSILRDGSEALHFAIVNQIQLIRDDPYQRTSGPGYVEFFMPGEDREIAALSREGQPLGEIRGHVALRIAAVDSDVSRTWPIRIWWEQTKTEPFLRVEKLNARR